MVKVFRTMLVGKNNLPNYNILIGCNIYIVYILPYSCIYILKLNVNVMNINKKYDVVINNNTKK